MQRRHAQAGRGGDVDRGLTNRGQGGALASREVNPIATQKQDSGDVDLRTKVRLMLLGLK